MSISRFITILFVLLSSLSRIQAQEEDVLRPKGKPLTTEELSKFSWTNQPEKRPFMVGLEFGMNYNTFSQTLSRNPPLSDSPNEVLASGSGISPFFGLVFEDEVSPNIAIQLKFMYDMKKVSNSVNGILEGTDASGFTIYEIPVTAKCTSTVSYFNIAPTLRYSIDPNYFVTLGVSYQQIMGDFKREDELSKSGNDDTTWISVDYSTPNPVPGQYKSISRTINQASDFLPPIQQSAGLESSKFVDYKTSRVGLEVGAGYLSQIDNSTALVFQLRYQYMFSVLNDSFSVNDLSKGPSNKLSNVTYENALLHSAQLSVGLWFKIL